MSQVHDNEGRWCCDIADGRPVLARVYRGKWQVLITKQKFGETAPNDWLTVPDSATKYIPNPVGEPIAWWYGGQVRCFVPSNGT